MQIEEENLNQNHIVLNNKDFGAPDKMEGLKLRDELGGASMVQGMQGTPWTKLKEGRSV